MLALLCACDDPKFVGGVDCVGTEQLTDEEELQLVADSVEEMEDS